MSDLNLIIKIRLQLIEGRRNLGRVTACLINSGNPSFDIDARLQCPQDLITCPEHSVEQRELLTEDLEDSLVRLVATVKEVNHHNVMLLTVAVTTANALFNPLRIPRQIKVNHQ